MGESDLTRTSNPPVRLLAVVVLYKLHPSGSSTLRTLFDSARQTSREHLELETLLWDNTPGGQEIGTFSTGVRYQAAPDNPGLSRAYNHALRIAEAEGFDWLLTLDQDSVLPINFLAHISELARKSQSIPTIAAIVPRVVGDGRSLSPFYFALGTIPRWFPHGVTGVPEQAVYALNSAATLRVTALQQIGGYDPMFPLDISDISLFHRLHRAGKTVFVAGDLLISHNFALLDKHQRMSLERYNAQLLDECAFWDLNMGFLARVERMIRLAGRACKDVFSQNDIAFYKSTTAEIKRRLKTPRARRIAEWKEWATARSAGDVYPTSAGSVPRLASPLNTKASDARPQIVVSGVNLTEMGPLAVFLDALRSLSKEYGDTYEITALVHRRAQFDIPNITYREFPDIKSSWLKRLHFEYWSSKSIADSIRPRLWLSMDNLTPNVKAEIQAVYCHNPSPFFHFRIRDLWLDWKFGLFTLFFHHLYAINLRRNDHVIVQQEWIRRSLQRSYAVKNVIVAHPAVDLPTATAIPPRHDTNRPYRFFYPAFPRTFKNVEVALMAAESLEKCGLHRFEIWLTFDEAMNRYASGIARRFSHVRSVRWLGLLPRQQVFQRFAAADCLLFPSKLETWGLPITEFKSTGKPMLVADLPYAHETVGSYPRVAFFNPDNPAELANLMSAAIGNKEPFSAVREQQIPLPFASNWTELWPLLLSPKGKAAERARWRSDSGSIRL